MDSELNQLVDAYSTLDLHTDDERLFTQFQSLAILNSHPLSQCATHHTFGMVNEDLSPDSKSSTQKQKRLPFELHKENSQKAKTSFAQRNEVKSVKEGEGWGDLPEGAISEYYKFGETSLLTSEHLGLGIMRLQGKTNYQHNDKQEFYISDENDNNAGFAKFATNDGSFLKKE
ncbi:hypothetical protein G9A89_013863 [Geosiphon pyriformis]|nr:hypothetical protein G9A89_013863 [Geosiphon pyriformis]